MNLRLTLVAVLAVVLIAGNLIIDRWEKTLYNGDSNGYYLHVVSFFVNQDVGDYDKTISSLKEIYPGYADPRDDKFGIRLTPKGRRYIKYTVGVPVLETPFFLLAHAYASMSDKYEANGWTKPYIFIVGFAPAIYILLGIYLLIGVLRRYFEPPVVVITILSLVLATNLFYHSNYVVMSHAFLFFLHSLLIHLSIRFYESPTLLRSVLVGATVGLITITRVPEVMVALVPLLWGVTSWKKFQERIRFFFAERPQYLLGAAAGFFLFFSLQVMYWYYVSGKFVFNPYQGEGFDFLDPKIHKGFFDFQNGWLIYTPIMAFSIYGFFVLKNGAKDVLLPGALFVFLHAYLHYSYYAWTFFPGLGQRPMVETYPLLSFGLAAAFTVFWQKKYLRWLPLTALIVFGALNLFQTWQMRKGVTWPERHNAAFYIETFGTLTPTLNSLRAYDTGQLQPEDDEIELIEVIHQDGFEDTTAYDPDQLTTQRAFAGERSYYSLKPGHELVTGLSLDGADWLKLSMKGFIAPGEQIWHRDLCMRLITELRGPNGERPRHRHLSISSHIGNAAYSIWSTGAADQWDEASYFVKIPKGEGWTATIFMRNDHGQKLYLDNFEVALYRER